MSADDRERTTGDAVPADDPDLRGGQAPAPDDPSRPCDGASGGDDTLGADDRSPIAAWAGDAVPFEPDPAARTDDARIANDDEPAGPDSSAEARDPGLRLARLHLRMGSLALARAELEAAAGRGTLDPESLVALAEVRWRTGDLAGAGEAAGVALDQGADDPIAYVIAAEAVAATGRPTEARQLADVAVERLDSSLDAVFAGMARSLIWPADAPPAAGPGGPVGEEPPDDRVAVSAAAEAFAGGRAALAAGDIPLATLRLSLAIRLDPRLAAGVLVAVEPQASVPLLALVTGDALRALGREEEALDAYDRARRPLVAEDADTLADPGSGPEASEPGDLPG